MSRFMCTSSLVFHPSEPKSLVPLVHPDFNLSSAGSIVLHFSFLLFIPFAYDYGVYAQKEDDADIVKKPPPKFISSNDFRRIYRDGGRNDGRTAVGAERLEDPSHPPPRARVPHPDRERAV